MRDQTLLESPPLQTLYQDLDLQGDEGERARGGGADGGREGDGEVMKEM